MSDVTVVTPSLPDRGVEMSDRILNEAKTKWMREEMAHTFTGHSWGAKLMESHEALRARVKVCEDMLDEISLAVIPDGTISRHGTEKMIDDWESLLQEAGDQRVQSDRLTNQIHENQIQHRRILTLEDELATLREKKET